MSSSIPDQRPASAAIRRPTLVHWLALLSLVVLWGSRYYAVEIALRAFNPLSIVFFQIVVAALVLYAVLRARGERLPRDLRSLGFFFAMALVGNVLPFFLESWGQVAIDSSLVGILMSVSPLSVLLLAYWLLPDERASGLRFSGFLLGLIGVVILIGPDALRALGGDATTIIAQLAVLLAAVCYGFAAVITRLAPRHPPLTMSAGVMIIAALQLAPVWLLREPWPSFDQVAWPPFVAVIAIGLFCTALAAIVFFYLIARTGAAFQSLTNYLLPVWAVMIGTTLLDEHLPDGSLMALALILLSLWITQRSAGD